MKKKYRILILFVCFVIVYFIIYNLNKHIVYIADDFVNLFDRNHQRVTTFYQVFDNLKHRYYSENGRLFAHGIGGILLMLNLSVIKVIESVVFVVMIYQIYSLSVGRVIASVKLYESPKHEKTSKDISKIEQSRCKYLSLYIPLIFLSIFLAIWMYVPEFGQDFLWIIGAANYMWTNVFILLLLIIAKRRVVFDKGRIGIFSTILLVILSFLAGSTNETPVPGMLVILFYYGVCAIVYNKKRILEVLIMGVVSIIGYVLMITAPGNFVRAEVFEKNVNHASGYDQILEGLNKGFEKYLLVLFIIAVVFIVVSRIINWKKSIESEIFLVSALISYYIMVLSPTLPPRALVMVVIFLIISVFMSISDIYMRSNILGIIIIILSFVYLGSNFLNTYKEAIDVNIRYEDSYYKRENIIKNNISKNNFNHIVVNKVVENNNKYAASNKLEDIKPYENDWVNYSIGQYYGVKSIKTVR